MAPNPLQLLRAAVRDVPDFPKAGILFKKMDATPTEKTAIDGTSVDSDTNKLVVKFKADDKNFQQLIESPMFASVVR